MTSLRRFLTVGCKSPETVVSTRSRWEMPLPSPNIKSDGCRYYVCSQHRKRGPCEHVRFILGDHLCILSAGQLSQHSPLLRCPYPSCRKLRVLPLPLRSHEKAPQLLGRNPRRTRSTKRVEDQVPLPAGGHDGSPYQAQGLLGGMVAVELLFLGHRRYGPDGGELGRGVSAVNEVVVEGVAGTSLASPEQCFVGVGPRKLGQRPAWRSEPWSGRTAWRR